MLFIFHICKKILTLVLLIRRTLMLGGVVVLLSLSESGAQNTYTLEACQTLALQNNKRIAIAKIDQQVATQEVKSAKTGRTPTATASGNGIYFLEGAGGLIPEQLLTFGVSVTQPIYLGGKVRNGIEAAGIGEKLASEQQALVEDEVIYQTQEYYWSLVALKEQLSLTNVQLISLKQLEEDLENTVEAGLAQKNDLLKVQVGINGVKLKQETLERELDLLKKVFQQHLGIEATENFDIVDTQIQVEEATLTQEALLNKATNQRPEIALIKNEIALIEKQQKIADADFLPQVLVSFNFLGLLTEEVAFPGPPNAEPEVLLEEYSNLIYPQLVVSIPLYKGGDRAIKRRKYRLRTEAKQKSLEQAQEGIQIEVYQATNQVLNTKRTIELNQQSVIQATENLRLFKDRFDAGVAKGADVLEAEFLLKEAETNVIDAKAQYKIALAQLDKATAQ